MQSKGEGILKLKTRNESSRETCNDNGVRLINSAQLQALSRVPTFPHHEIPT